MRNQIDLRFESDLTAAILEASKGFFWHSIFFFATLLKRRGPFEEP